VPARPHPAGNPLPLRPLAATRAGAGQHPPRSRPSGARLRQSRRLPLPVRFFTLQVFSPTCAPNVPFSNHCDKIAVSAATP
jgi:hypothetical protein